MVLILISIIQHEQYYLIILFINRPKGWNFIKKETLAQMFSCEFCEISKNNFLTKHLRTTASGKGPKYASDQCKGKSETYDDKIVCFIFHYC